MINMEFSKMKPSGWGTMSFIVMTPLGAAGLVWDALVAQGFHAVQPRPTSTLPHLEARFDPLTD